MLKDFEGNDISMADIPNSIRFFYGNSGYGKTYGMVRYLETEKDRGKKILLLDYSGSFTAEERQKANFNGEIVVKNPYKEPVYVCFNKNASDAADLLAHAMSIALRITSYYQIMILKEVLKTSFEKTNIVSMESIKFFLSPYLESSKNELKDNANHLVTRFMPYFGVVNLFFKNDILENNDKQVLLLQLSDFSNLEREFLATLVIEVFWSFVRNKVFNNFKFDTFILDEFQNLSLKKGGALYGFLKEGRRFGISLVLATQLLSCFEKDGVNTLFQAGNVLVFHPARSDLKTIAKIVSTDNYKQYENILNNLKRGQCLLLGNYYRNNSSKLYQTPLLCNVNTKNCERK